MIITLICLIRFESNCIRAVWKRMSRIYWHSELNVKVPWRRIVQTNFHWNDLYAAGICTDEMPFKHILYSSSITLCISALNHCTLNRLLKMFVLLPTATISQYKMTFILLVCTYTHMLRARLDTICLFYPMTALRVIMRWRTIAHCSMKWNLEMEKQPGDGRQQGRTPFNSSHLSSLTAVPWVWLLWGRFAVDENHVYESFLDFSSSWPPMNTASSSSWSQSCSCIAPRGAGFICSCHLKQMTW